MASAGVGRRLERRRAPPKVPLCYARAHARSRALERERGRARPGLGRGRRAGREPGARLLYGGSGGRRRGLRSSRQEGAAGQSIGAVSGQAGVMRDAHESRKAWSERRSAMSRRGGCGAVLVMCVLACVFVLCHRPDAAQRQPTARSPVRGWGSAQSVVASDAQPRRRRALGPYIYEIYAGVRSAACGARLRLGAPSPRALRDRRSLLTSVLI